MDTITGQQLALLLKGGELDPLPEDELKKRIRNAHRKKGDQKRSTILSTCWI